MCTYCVKHIVLFYVKILNYIYVSVCQSPPFLPNGAIEISSDLSTATYTCNVNYVMVGIDTRTCMQDGTGWSGAAPTCGMTSHKQIQLSNASGTHENSFLETSRDILFALIRRLTDSIFVS